MGVRHVVMFSLVPDVTDDQLDALRTAAQRLADSVPDVRNFECGRDLGEAEGNYHFAVVADFDDAEAYRRYRDHPEHVKFFQQNVAPLLVHRAAVQHEFSQGDGTAHRAAGDHVGSSESSP